MSPLYLQQELFRACIKASDIACEFSLYTLSSTALKLLVVYAREA